MTIAADTDGIYLTLHDMDRLRGSARGFSFLPHQPSGSVLAGPHASALRGRGLDFRELRAYAQGDDIRSIDWLATARLGDPYTRVYAEERDRLIILLVDQRQTMFFGSKIATKSYIAAKAAVLAAWRVHAVGDRIASLVFTDEKIAYCPAARGLGSIRRVLTDIATANTALNAAGTTQNPGMLNKALQAAARIVHHDALVVIFSDVFGADEQTRRLVTDISLHSDVIASFIYDPLEAALPEIGQVVVAQGTQRLKIDTRPEHLRRDFAQNFAERQQTVLTFGRRRAIPVINLRTDEDVATQLRAALAPRPRR
jgi:uncharacterized protein (DUF58 family)